MKSINFKEATNKIAEHQEQFNTVISQWNLEEKSVNMCFELDDQSIEEINKTKVLWYKQIIGSGNMHPMRISAFKEGMITERKEIKDLTDIDTTTPEGKMFMASLAMLTTGNHKNKTPYEVIEMVLELSKKMQFT